MKSYEINTAIAETQGAKWYLHASGYSWLSFSALDEHPRWKAIEKPSDLSEVVIGESVPDYHHSLDAIVPVVRAMPYDKIHNVLKALGHVRYHAKEFGDMDALATPAQWCEAVLREAGLWK